MRGEARNLSALRRIDEDKKEMEQLVNQADSNIDLVVEDALMKATEKRKFPSALINKLAKGKTLCKKGKTLCKKGKTLCKTPGALLQRGSGPKPSKESARSTLRENRKLTTTSSRSAIDRSTGVPEDLYLPIRTVFMRRLSVLFTLMMCQSLSSIILSKYEKLLSNHVAITLFLTMLVGAGGNAGNQVAVSIIRGIATDHISVSRHPRHGKLSATFVFLREAMIGFLLACALAVVAYFRVRLFMEAGGEDRKALAISVACSCWVIVFTSAIVGGFLPMCLYLVGFDPAHAGPSVQVIMDIFGVGMTCWISSLLMS